MSEERPARHRRRPFLMGLAVGLGVGALSFIAARATNSLLWSPQFNVEVVVRGDDVSRRGGTTIVVHNARGGETRQLCVETCDDLQLLQSSSDNSYWVEVLDPAGRKLIADHGTYVTNGPWVTRWTVAGRQPLEVRVSNFSRRADGMFEETLLLP